MKLTRVERWILANQYRILQELSEQPTKLYDQVIQILEQGYEDEYDFAAQYLRDETLPHIIAEEVKDILRMFSEFQWIRDQVTLRDYRHEALFHFWGFDGNNNHEYLAYASFLLERGDFRDLGMTSCANSHSDTIETYRSMVRLWKALPSHGLDMTESDVLAILDGPILENLTLPKRSYNDKP